MWDILRMPSEATVISACFRIVGRPLYYNEAELTALGVAGCEDKDVSAVEKLIRLNRIGLEDFFEQYLVWARADEVRKSQGMVFTPDHLVRSMIDASLDSDSGRVIDCGCGAGRFALHASEKIQKDRIDASVLAVDIDPLACLLTATAAVLKGLSIDVRRADFLELELQPAGGKTLFIGNPPYVRHHAMTGKQKERGRELASSLGLTSWSKLSGLHACFLVKCLCLAAEGDTVCFLTGAEWLDVKYGSPLRQVFLSERGGGSELVLFNPDLEVFKGVMSTALISLWHIGSLKEQVKLVSAKSDNSNEMEEAIESSDVMKRAEKWGSFFPGRKQKASSCSSNRIKLGDIFSISRGIATGCNNFFVIPASDELAKRFPECFVPVIAHAKEVITAGGVISSERLSSRLLMCDEAQVAREEELQEYLLLGKSFGVHKGYVASHRKRWWCISGKPAPIVSTYMARGLPTFALNPHKYVSLNTVHGLYPKMNLNEKQLEAIVSYLNSGAITTEMARVYQGGLCKFEPRDMEEIEIPPLTEIEEWSVKCPASTLS